MHILQPVAPKSPTSLTSLKAPTGNVPAAQKHVTLPTTPLVANPVGQASNAHSKVASVVVGEPGVVSPVPQSPPSVKSAPQPVLAVSGGPPITQPQTRPAPVLPKNGILSSPLRLKYRLIICLGAIHGKTPLAPIAGSLTHTPSVANGEENFFLPHEIGLKHKFRASRWDYHNASTISSRTWERHSGWKHPRCRSSYQ